MLVEEGGEVAGGERAGGDGAVQKRTGIKLWNKIELLVGKRPHQNVEKKSPLAAIGNVEAQFMCVQC